VYPNLMTSQRKFGMGIVHKVVSLLRVIIIVIDVSQITKLYGGLIILLKKMV